MSPKSLPQRLKKAWKLMRPSHGWVHQMQLEVRTSSHDFTQMHAISLATDKLSEIIAYWILEEKRTTSALTQRISKETKRWDNDD